MYESRKNWTILIETFMGLNPPSLNVEGLVITNSQVSRPADAIDLSLKVFLVKI